jgi:hypothetical protein
MQEATGYKIVRTTFITLSAPSNFSGCIVILSSLHDGEFLPADTEYIYYKFIIKSAAYFTFGTPARTL